MSISHNVDGKNWSVQKECGSISEFRLQINDAKAKNLSVQTFEQLRFKAILHHWHAVIQSVLQVDTWNKVPYEHAVRIVLKHRDRFGKFQGVSIHLWVARETKKASSTQLPGKITSRKICVHQIRGSLRCCVFVLRQFRTIFSIRREQT